MAVFGTPEDLSAQAGGPGTLSAKLRAMTEQLNTLGASGDPAATPGSAGTQAAKLRLITTQLDLLSRGVPISGAVTVQGSQGSFTDRSGTLAASGIAQTVAAANTSRKYLLLQNQSTGNLWFNFGATAQIGQPSLRLDPGASFVLENAFICTQSLSLVGLTTGQAFAAKEG